MLARILSLVLLAAAIAPAQDAAPPRVTRTVEIIRDIEDGVVAIFSREEESGKLHSGSGSIIHPKGFVLTNDHVTRDRPGVVLLEGQRPVPYRIVGRLPEKDMAIVRIPVANPPTVIRPGHSADLMTGEPVLSGGNPGGRGIVFSSGIVSSKAIMKDAPNALVMSHFASDMRDRFIQFDAASNRGNSGGPLINAEGRQIGIVSASIVNEENINYAIPIDRLRRYFGEMVAPEITRNLFTGIEVDALARGARVVSVAPESPAGKAGLKKGDVLKSADGAPLRDGLDWLLTLADASPDGTIALEFERDGETKQAELAIATYPTPAPTAFEGMKAGLAWKLFAGGPLADFPDFAKLEPTASGVAKTLAPRKLAGDRKQNFALVFDGFLDIKRDGVQRLVLASDDGSRLFLHDKLLIDNGGPHPRQEIGGKVRLSKGLHPIRIEYFEATGDATLELFLENPRGERTELAEGAFFHRPAE